MRLRELYTIVFTEYPGHLGFGPAVIACAIIVALGASIAYGGITLGKSVFAHTPTEEGGHS